MFEEDYREYQKIMQENHLQGVLADAANYADHFGLASLLEQLHYHSKNPQEGLLMSRCLDYLENQANILIRNQSTAEWIRIQEDLKDDF